MKDLIKAAKDIMKTMENLEASSSRQSETFNNHFKQTVSIMDDYATQMTESSKTIMGASRSYEEMEKNQKKIGARQKKYYDEILAIEKKIRKIRNDGTEDGIQLDAEAAEKRIEQLNYEMTLQMKHAKKIHDYEAGLLQERATERENRYKEFQDLTRNHKKNMERMGAFGKNMGSMAKTGDIGGMATGGLDALGGILKQLGGIGGTLGAVATTLGATVGLLGVFVALMFEADKKAKDMNKNFMQGASGLDLMGKNFRKGQLTKRLFDMREMAFDVGMQFRMSAEDVATLASSFNQFGLRYDEMARMSGEGDPVEALEENLSVAIKKSKMLGVEASTVAEQIAQMNENFAMDLSQIDEAFTAIYTSAQTTGIATQKFFAMITQVTGGMSLLNVDFAQTAAIAGELVESLGEAAGSKFLSDLANRGASKSYQDRMKSALLSGGKTSRISKKGVRARAKQLENSAGFKQLAGSSEFRNTLESLGVTGFDSNDIMGSLNKMTMQQQRNLIASSGNTAIGGSAEIERQLRALQQLNISSKQGGVTGAAVQMGQFNTGENLAQFLAEAGAFADLSKGQSLGGMSRAVLEQISGKSGMEVDQLVTMVDKMNSNMGVVQTYSDRMNQMMKEGDTGEAALAKLAQEQNMSTIEFQKMLQEQYKLTIGEDGKVKSSITGSEIKGLDDYMINMGDSMKDGINEAMTKEEAMTQEIIKNTASASAVLENMIGKQLNKISGFVEGIYDFLTYEKRDFEGEEKRARTRNLDDMIEAEYERKQNLEDEVKAMEKSKGSSKREKALLAAKKEELRITTATLKAREAERSALLTTGSEKQMRERMATINDELMAETGSGTLTQEQQNREDELRRKAEEEFVMQTTRHIVGSVVEGDLVHDYGFGKKEGFDLRFMKDVPAVKALYETNSFGMSEERIDEIMAKYTTIEKGHADRDSRADAFTTGEQGSAALFESDSLLGMERHGYNKGLMRGDFHQRKFLEDTVSARASAQTGLMTGNASQTDVLENLNDDQYNQLVEATAIQKKLQEESGDQRDLLDDLVTQFEDSGKDTAEMKKFQEKNLSPAIGKEVMKAMVAEKLFDVAGASGMSLEDILKAQKTQNDGIAGNDILIGNKIDAEIAKLNPENDADRIAELQKQKANLKTLGLQDAAYIDGKMYPEGKGAIITTPDGTSYHTDDKDNMLIGTNVGKGGGSAAGQTVIMNVDKVVTTARNGAELADSLMKEMKRNPNTKKRLRRSRN